MNEKKRISEEELDKVAGGKIFKEGRCSFVCNDCSYTWKGSFLTAKCKECGSKNISKQES